MKCLYTSHLMPEDSFNTHGNPHHLSRFREDRSLTRLDAKFWKKMGVLPLLDRLDETGKILPDEPSGKLEEEEQILLLGLELEILEGFFSFQKQ